MEYFEFIETPTFLRKREELLDDDTFRELQEYLLLRHVDGDTIRSTGGCQKLRWNRPGSGKRGGVRVIYYAITRSGKIYLLMVYAKNVKDDLSDAEKKTLKWFTEQVDSITPFQQATYLRMKLWIKNSLTIWFKAWKRWWRLKKAKCSLPASTAMLCLQ